MKNSNWRELVPNCFANEAAPFGMHSIDKEWAKKMFHIALHQGATMLDIISEAKKYLKSKNANEAFIKSQEKLIKKFTNPYKNNIKKKRVWLVTWEGTDISENKHADNIVSIFDPRISTNRIKDFLENHYMSACYTIFERATYSTNRKLNPYPAEYFSINGIRWMGKITCGHNPFLNARLVENFIVHINDMGEEIVTWKEVPNPKK